MIVSHRWKFIFLKTTKTAGTSLELALSPFLGADDIVTLVDPAEEQLRSASPATCTPPRRGPSLAPRSGTATSSSPSAVNPGIACSRITTGTSAAGAGARSARRRSASSSPPAGRLAVDQVYRYEALSDALLDLRTRLGLPQALEMPRAKASTRSDRRGYAEFLDAEDRDCVAQIFHEEIERFGYRF